MKMIEVIAEIQVLVEFGLMTELEAGRIIARMEGSN